MHKIAQANIDRLNALLKDEPDPVKRAMIVRLCRRAGETEIVAEAREEAGLTVGQTTLGP